MFQCFFPKPRWFFLSAVIWTICNVLLWCNGGKEAGIWFGWSKDYVQTGNIIGIARFWSPMYLWFYIWFVCSVSLFASFWRLINPHPWQYWSVWGSALILFNIWFMVQVNVVINAWYGPFWDLIQGILAQKKGEIADLYQGSLTFLYIAILGVTISMLNDFFVSHYIFRWRSAMNSYYIDHWVYLRQVEGASQRVQEDTMRFASTMEDLGVSFIRAVMILIAFLPILFELSKHVPELPVIGALNHSLVWAALVWSLFGTLILMLTGIKLPGLQFNNQKVEAAYRKELVYGEDYPDRAQPLTLRQLFDQVRINYFRLYFHYAYFNMVSTWYIQLDILFGLVILFPSIAAGIMTLGLINQIANVFSKVRASFQYLINSWKTIVELLSIYKRLRAFESILKK